MGGVRANFTRYWGLTLKAPTSWARILSDKTCSAFDDGSGAQNVTAMGTNLGTVHWVWRAIAAARTIDGIEHALISS